MCSVLSLLAWWRELVWQRPTVSEPQPLSSWFGISTGVRELPLAPDPQPKSAWRQPQGGSSMFDDLVVSSANPKRTNTSWTVMVSTIVQAAILGVLILIPLIYTEALPK